MCNFFKGSNAWKYTKSNIREKKQNVCFSKIGWTSMGQKKT